MTKYIKFSLPLFLLLGLIILPFSTLAVVPSGTPPTCPSSNPACNPPINVGDVNQTKVGGIGVQGNLAAYGKMIISALTRLSLGNPTKGKWGGSGDKFILKSGADNNSTFPVSLGLASTHMWNSIPAGLFYAWYINGIEKMRLTDSGLDINGQIRIRGGSPGVGKVLVSDATGLASWQTGYGGLPVGTTHQTLRHDGTAWTATDVLRTGGASINVRSSSAQTGITLNNTSAGGHDFHFYSGGDASTIAPNGFVLRDNSAGANRLIINKHGNIGIGTNSPTGKLDVNGTITGNRIRINEKNPLELGVGLSKHVNAGKIVYQIFSTGLDIIGAGTTAGSRLVKLWDNVEVAGNITTNNVNATNLCTIAGSCETVENIINQTGGQTGGGLPVGTTHQTLRHDGTAWTATDVLRTGGASINVRSSSAQTGITLNNTSAGGHDFHFYSGGDASTIAPNGFVLRDNSAGANRLIINKHGNIGIGTNSPTAKLDVNGTIFSKGLVSNGSITMVDGTQGVGKVMVSDASGKGSWKTPSELGLGGSTYTVGSGLTLSSTNVFSLTHPIINFAGRNINGTLNLIEGTFSFNLIERTCPSGEFMTGILADGSIVCQSQDGGDQDLYQCPVRPNDSTCARALGAPYPASTCTGQVSSYSKCTYYGYNQVGHYCTAMQTNCTSI